MKHDPDHGEAHNNLGNTLHLTGKLEKALSCYRRAARLLDKNPQVHHNYGTALYEAGLTDQAISELQQVIDLAPDHAEAHAALGVAFQAREEFSRAAASLQKAVSLNPGYLEAQRFLGLVMKDQGDMAGAISRFRMVLKADPADALTRYILSKYQRYSSEEEAETQKIKALLDNRSTPADDKIFFHFTLGKIFDDIGRYSIAFHHYKEGNRLRLATFSPGVIDSGINIKSIRQAFCPQLFQRLSAAGNITELPVFIVGMPRSGTSLVEQICASHSAILGRGELKTIGELIPKHLPDYPYCLSTVQPELIDKITREYLEVLQKKQPVGGRRITDKMPTNFIELGLIRLLFPRAAIIHCRRDPLDTCLSNFCQNFEEGNEFSFDLKGLGFYYRKYKKLMEFWQETLTGPMLEMEYEKLVKNPEYESKRLINFLGLPWEENCLSFFKTKRAVHTSSDWQVRQPIYNSSVGRWRNYADHLSPLRQALESKLKLR